MYSTGGGSRESGAASRGRSERSESSVGPDGAAEVVRRKLVRRRRWRGAGKNIVSGDAG